MKRVKSGQLEERAAKILAHLRQLKEDRGAMADLRRILNPAQRYRAWPHLATVHGIDDPRIEVVAGLFAYHPDETAVGNLGTTCRKLSAENEGFEKRFLRLLACNRDEVCDRLRPIVLAARSRGIPVNYQQLFQDLVRWSHRIKADWAREFWTPGVESGAAPGQATGEGSSS